ncbi:enoyl-CoA hydratase-related protein [Novosphingobium sp.]|uniref:enoyl-CoA hydratase-related protein n=1 Tax=Novosphingobium sp. TaxID=1874826 RepID=UPI0022C6BCCE|nr:enoyl-CoA hydratase-related protein [Novosphingobium sp.]MCZ8020100.1 enoyl-CoA hydratase-related protein [Novosphingobium sp.]MCZ8035745.1 enoyl-CoA hydratase-related protein [Novosphingobium sp.]MCZ8053143.1 enoyl-CoA hydratase-related protein [Novosphingobium sp.]MCZ8061140.1 enoyl-CoA hydratase-related protein [Novosphingobium sp.]MCZ8230869.1 enoyl-CoA hydratase-related protein [Novosphingobium sp.]
MSAAFETLLVEQDGPILWLRLNRPEVLNAYTSQMGAELARGIALADSDDSVKVVVITGTGRVFCAGADVSAGAGAFDTESGEGAKNFGSRDGRRENSDFIGAMMNSVKPLLVAFNGSAAGVGLTLTLPCDIRIAADTAKFGCVFTRRGLVPEAGSAWFLPRLVGLATALKWCMTGALVPAHEALAAGLVSELVPADQVETRARELALEIAANCSPVALALTRQMLWRFSGEDGPQGALAVDAALNIALGARADVHEGVAAFLEKRQPQFPLKVSTDLADLPWSPTKPTGYR